MIKLSILETPRLWLRPLEVSDCPAVQKSAADRKIADTMISLPHPYPAGYAEQYLSSQQAERKAGRSATFTIKPKAEECFSGLVEVRDIDRNHWQGELSFWLAAEAWGRGYMSEVIQAVVRYAFESLDLYRLYAYHMLRNPASGRVLEKNGFKQEGLLRQRVQKWGQFEDVLLWAILRQEWQDALDQ